MLNTKITQKPITDPADLDGMVTIKYGGPELQPPTQMPAPPSQQQLPDTLQQWKGADQVQKG